MKEQELKFANNFIAICKRHEEFCLKKAKKHEKKDLLCTIATGIFSLVGVTTTAIIGPPGVLVFSFVIFPGLAKRTMKWKNKAQTLRDLARDFGELRKEIEENKARNFGFDQRKFSVILIENEKRVGRT